MSFESTIPRRPKTPGGFGTWRSPGAGEAVAAAGAGTTGTGVSSGMGAMTVRFGGVDGENVRLRPPVESVR